MRRKFTTRLLVWVDGVVVVRQSYVDGRPRGDVTLAAKTLGELISRKLTPVTALAAAIEVKVETTVVSGEPGKSGSSRLSLPLPDRKQKLCWNS